LALPWSVKLSPLKERIKEFERNKENTTKVTKGHEEGPRGNSLVMSNFVWCNLNQTPRVSTKIFRISVSPNPNAIDLLIMTCNFLWNHRLPSLSFTVSAIDSGILSVYLASPVLSCRAGPQASVYRPLCPFLFSLQLLKKNSKILSNGSFRIIIRCADVQFLIILNKI